MEAARILVFGDAGVGKTSIINMLTGQNGKISNSALGVTCESKDYTFKKDNREYIFTDTIGLNESNDGTICAREALLNLIKLIKKAQLGFNLAIFVIKADRILTTSRKNYELIVEKLLNYKINVLCVVTHADSGKVINSWWNENSEAFKKKNMMFTDHLVIYSGDPSIYDGEAFIDSMTKLKESSAKSLWDKILDSNLVPAKPVKVIENDSDLIVLLKELWNFICDVLHIDTLKFPVNSTRNIIISILEKIGIPNPLQILEGLAGIGTLFNEF